jgi:hypothetical protein
MHTFSGSILLTNTYELNFDREINYCDELKHLFYNIKETLESNITVSHDDNLNISISHHTPLAGKEADLVLLYLTAVYYDCDVNIYANKNLKYILKIIDGYVKRIEIANKIPTLN